MPRAKKLTREMILTKIRWQKDNSQTIRDPALILEKSMIGASNPDEVILVN